MAADDAAAVVIALNWDGNVTRSCAFGKKEERGENVSAADTDGQAAKSRERSPGNVLCAWHWLSREKEWTNRKKEGKKTSARKLKAREGLLGSALQMSSLAGIVHARSDELRNPISVTQLKCSTSWNFKTHFSLIIIRGPWALSNSN